MYNCKEYGHEICESQCIMSDKNGKCIHDGKCQPVVEQCKGCGRINDNGFCKAYINPKAIWEHKEKCPLATHLIERIENDKKKVNPIKKSKRKGR